VSDEKTEDEVKDEEKSEGEPDEKPDDAADQAAIARRVAALGGEEDETEKIAREEERKLAERRAAGKKGKKKKGGLEVAAAKKLEKIGKRAEPKRSVAVAADADPLIERTAKLSEWAKQNQKLVQRVGALIAVALLATAGYMWWDHKRETEASVLLSKAIETQGAQIGEPPKEDDEENPVEHGLMFKTFDERREASIAKYKEVEQKYSGTGAAILARLAEASLLLDKHDADGAAAAFTDVKNSALGSADKEVRGRAIEGLGLAYEIKKSWDPALEAYKELESITEIKGFKELSWYHQGRVHEAKGEKDKAKELYLKIKEVIDKPDENAIPGVPAGPQFPYLREVAMDRLRAIDPASAPKIQGMPGGGAQALPPQVRKALEDAQKKAAGGGGGGGGH